MNSPVILPRIRAVLGGSSGAFAARRSYCYGSISPTFFRGFMMFDHHPLSSSSSSSVVNQQYHYGTRTAPVTLYRATPLSWRQQQQRSSFCSAAAASTFASSVDNENGESEIEGIDDNENYDEEDEDDDFDEILNGGLPLVKVAIIGPPNAGKSTLYNRFLDKKVNKTYRLNSEKDKKTGRHLRDQRRFGSPKHKKSYSAGSAIVSDVPGTTRDRREGTGRIGDIYFHIIDTAGVDGERLDSFFKTKTMDGTNNNPDGAGTMTMETHKQRRRKEKQQLLLEEGGGGGNRKKKKLQILRNLPSSNIQSMHVTPKEILRPMMQHALAAARDAHLILLMFDARVGLTSDFYETCKWLRRYASRAIRKEDKKKKSSSSSSSAEQHDNDEVEEEPQRIMIVANKLEGEHWNYDGSAIWENIDEATKVGFGRPVMISAIHGDNISELGVAIHELQEQLNSRYEDEPTMEDDHNTGGDGSSETFHVFESDDAPLAMRKKPRPPISEFKEKPLQLAILGRVNVGKSTLVNSLLKQDRVITGPTPGLTRDAISIPWSFHGRPVQLVDTAGLRKPTKRKDGEIEDMAVLDAMRAMKVADVAVLVLDAGALFLTRHELAICQTVLREGRALVIAANKMDLIVNQEYTPMDFAKGVREQLESRYPMLRQTPIVAMSSLTGKNVARLMPVVFDARDRWERKIPTGHLNRWLAEVLDEHRPPAVAGKHTKIKFMAQTKGRPPTFLLFSNHTEIPENYIRYLTRQFQESFNFFGMEVRFVVKQSVNPFVERLPVKRRRGFGLGGKTMQDRRKWQRLKETGSPRKVHKRSARKLRW